MSFVVVVTLWRNIEVWFDKFKKVTRNTLVYRNFWHVEELLNTFRIFFLIHFLNGRNSQESWLYRFHHNWRKLKFLSACIYMLPSSVYQHTSRVLVQMAIFFWAIVISLKIITVCRSSICSSFFLYNYCVKIIMLSIFVEPELAFGFEIVGSLLKREFHLWMPASLIVTRNMNEFFGFSQFQNLVG